MGTWIAIAILIGVGGYVIYKIKMAASASPSDAPVAPVKAESQPVAPKNPE